MKYMRCRNYHFQTLKDIANANDIKSSFCYVSDKFWKDLSRDINGGSVGRTVRYYDGTYLRLGEERYIAGETLFRPMWATEKCPGIHEAIVKAVSYSPPMVQPTLLNNVVLCGGTSLLRGLPERITQELRSFPESSDLNVVSLPRREAAAWIGGSLLAAEIKQSPELITRELYQENGPNIIRNMCI